MRTIWLIVAAIGVSWAGVETQAAGPTDIYTVPPGTAAGIGGQMYPAPVSVPPQVGITTIHPPLAPHEFLYHHKAHYRDCGTKTHVRYGFGINGVADKLHRIAWGPKR